MLRQGEELVETATALGQPLLLFWAHNSVALAEMGLGQLDRALQRSELARSDADRTGDAMRLAVAEANLGIIQCFQGSGMPPGHVWSGQPSCITTPLPTAAPRTRCNGSVVPAWPSAIRIGPAS